MYIEDRYILLYRASEEEEEEEEEQRFSKESIKLSKGTGVLFVVRV